LRIKENLLLGGKRIRGKIRPWWEGGEVTPFLNQKKKNVTRLSKGTCFWEKGAPRPSAKGEKPKKGNNGQEKIPREAGKTPPLKRGSNAFFKTTNPDGP